MQIEETERLKLNLIKSKENSNVSMQHQQSHANQQPRVTFSFATSDEGFSSHSNSTNTSHHQYSSAPADECAHLRSQLKDANVMIDELKVNFRKNLFDLQTKLQECIDDKERLQIKKLTPFNFI